jgi:hypothetical protein
MSGIDKEFHFKLLRQFAENPQVSQRELAAHPGLSLGKARQGKTRQDNAP